YKKKYMDAMTLVQRFGKPDIFLTVTCNPNLQEIKVELHSCDLAHDRPDLISRIFRAKLKELKDDLIKRRIFGPIGPELSEEAQSIMLNDQIAKMTTWSMAVIVLPSIIFLVVIFLYMSKGMQRLSGLTEDELLMQKPAAPKS
ncbi:MAG: hypothetical protein EOP06_14365, partial [Proteobacteria bacterium]